MKILIVRLSSIGDILLTTPLVRCLYQQNTDVEIHFLTKKIYKDIYLHNPYIHKLWTVEKSPKEIFDLLLKENFDFLIDLHKNFRSLWLKANLPVEFASFPKKNIEKFIMIKTKNRKPISNVALRYFKAAERFNISYDEQGLDFFFPMIFNFDNYLPPQFIAFAIGGTYFTKKYPLEYVVEFCKLSTLPVIILGGESEKKEGEYISEQVGDKVINFCGKLSLTESAYVVNNSKLVISNDTGMMHLAAALHKSMISIWGNTVPEFGMYPLYPENCDAINVYIQNDKISCRPCSKLGYSKCPKKHFDCMMSLTPDKLNNLCNEMIKDLII